MLSSGDRYRFLAISFGFIGLMVQVNIARVYFVAYKLYSWYV